MTNQKPEKFRACIYPDDELVYDAEDIDAFLEEQAAKLLSELKKDEIDILLERRIMREVAVALRGKEMGVRK